MVDPLGPLASLGLGGAAAAAILYAWRQDRTDRAEERKADQDRYNALAEDFRSIVQMNTAAFTQLTGAIHELPNTAAFAQLTGAIHELQNKIYYGKTAPAR